MHGPHLCLKRALVYRLLFVSTECIYELTVAKRCMQSTVVVTIMDGWMDGWPGDIMEMTADKGPSAGTKNCRDVNGCL
jgi:hypothetical protein